MHIWAGRVVVVTRRARPRPRLVFDTSYVSPCSSATAVAHVSSLNQCRRSADFVEVAAKTAQWLGIGQ